MPCSNASRLTLTARLHAGLAGLQGVDDKPGRRRDSSGLHALVGRQIRVAGASGMCRRGALGDSRRLFPRRHWQFTAPTSARSRLSSCKHLQGGWKFRNGLPLDGHNRDSISHPHALRIDDSVAPAGQRDTAALSGSLHRHGCSGHLHQALPCPLQRRSFA